jgi:hypothetical protein
MNHLGGDEAMDGKESSFFQHLIVSHIVDTFSRVQGSHVNVLVQDPAYSTFSKALITLHFPRMQVVEDPEAFLAMDKHTFLFHCHMPFDAGAIALSVAGDEGLAGMMCAQIMRGHELELAGAEVNAGTNPAHFRGLVSISKVEWAKKCVELDVDAEGRWLGEGQDVLFYLRMDEKE